jgi:NADH:ubiquinone oxidoreductase subunit 3 (subunit A)
MALTPIGIFIIVIPAMIFGLVFLLRWLNADNTDSDAERNCILAMVESGKVSSDEASELLDAMGKSSALRGQEKFSRQDIAILIGCSLVIMGFFLPWNSVRFSGMQDYQCGYDAKSLGWSVFIIAVLTAAAVFVTPKSFLYKISMLQIFLCSVGVAIVISTLFRVIQNLRVGLPICLFGFLLVALACLAKFKKLAA